MSGKRSNLRMCLLERIEHEGSTTLRTLPEPLTYQLLRAAYRAGDLSLRSDGRYFLTPRACTALSRARGEAE